MSEDMLCPIYGHKLFKHPHDNHVLDGPTYYSSIEEPKLVYEIWPRDYNHIRLKDRFWKINNNGTYTEMVSFYRNNFIKPDTKLELFILETVAFVTNKISEWIFTIKNRNKPKDNLFPLMKYKNDSILIDYELIEVKPLSAPIGVIYFYHTELKERESFLDSTQLEVLNKTLKKSFSKTPKKL